MTIQDLRELVQLLEAGTVKVSSGERLVKQLVTAENLLQRIMDEKTLLENKAAQLNTQLTKYSHLVKTIRSQLEAIKELDTERLTRQQLAANGH